MTERSILVTFIVNTPCEWPCINRAAKEAFFEIVSFFLDLEYFDTFLSFQSLNVFYKMCNRQMMQIDKFRTAGGLKH